MHVNLYTIKQFLMNFIELLSYQREHVCKVPDVFHIGSRFKFAENATY